MTDPPGLWNGVLRRLEAELPAFAVEAWLRPLAVEPEGDELRLVCPSPFHRSRVQERYLARIAESLARELGRPVRVVLELPRRDEPSRPPNGVPLAPGAAPEPPPAADVAVSARPAGPPDRTAAPAERGAASSAPRPAALAGPARSPGGSPRQGALPHTFHSFVVGPCNALAREASLAVAEARQLGVNPLYLVSTHGLGKTHLARAVVAEARARGARGALYLSAEQFTSELMTGLRARRMAEFKQRFRERCELLALEDVQFLSGKTSTQLELFHTLEHLLGAGVRVVVTGNRLPKQLDALDPALESRLASGLVAEIEPPNEAVRREILRAKAAAGGVRLPDDCLERITEAVSASVRDLESVLIQVVASASLLKRPIDLALTEAALRKLSPEPREGGGLEPAAVIDVVAVFFKTSPQALASRSRRREVLLPRQIAMYLCHRYTDASLKRIGQALGRDHPSVANAIRAVERALLERAPLRYQVEALCARLDARTHPSLP